MDRTSIIYISAEVAVGLTSAVGNCIVLVAILRTRRLHTITNVFVGNLAIADIVVGFLVAPLAALSFKGLPQNFYGCVLVNSLILLFTNVSIFMLLAVALERFLAIKEPFIYQRVLTVRRAIKINMAVWLLGTLLGLVPLYGWNSGNKDIESCQFTAVITYEYMVYFQFFGLVLVPLSLMLSIYIYIFIIVRRHSRQTHALHRHVQLNNPTAGERRQQDRDAADNRKFNKDVRAAKMFALLIVLFGVFWLPVNIFNCLSLFCPKECKFTYEALLVAIVMSHANSSINPFIYATSNSRIKKAIKVMFGWSGSIHDSSTEINNEGRTTNGVTVNRTAARDNGTHHNLQTHNETHRESPTLPFYKIFTINPVATLEVEDKQKDTTVSATVHPSSSVDSTQNHSSGIIRDAQITEMACHRRNSFAAFSTYSPLQRHNKAHVHKSLSHPQTMRRRSCSMEELNLSGLSETQLAENSRKAKLFCVELQTGEQTSEQTFSSMCQYHPQIAPSFCEQHSPQSHPDHSTCLHNSEAYEHVPWPQIDTNINGAEDNGNDSSIENKCSSKHSNVKDKQQKSAEFGIYGDMECTEVMKDSFELEEMTSSPTLDKIPTGVSTLFDNVFRTLELPLTEFPLNSVDLDLTSDSETVSSIRSRAKLKSPSLFSELEESNMAQSKWAHHTKL
ncbi:adenosine receptor A1-like [Elysia marginata]|uniref:Adenosine receptor A1-like n=1 Tax=Elysia marginata TaxID=1093978 RepID=A0AAV4F403_9GAST|nr:adenosine receptor A1-like [Elysia marginata]